MLSLYGKDKSFDSGSSANVYDFLVLKNNREKIKPKAYLAPKMSPAISSHGW